MSSVAVSKGDKPFLYKVAVWISSIFHPLLLVPLLILIVLIEAGVAVEDWLVYVLMLFFIAMIPGIYALHRYYVLGRDLDIAESQDRIPAYILAVGSTFVAVLIAYQARLSPLRELLVGIWMLLIVFFGVNYIYKISVHVGVATVLAFYMLMYFGWQVWWVLLIPILVGWSRVYLHSHKLGQVMLGLVVPILVLGVVYRQLGLVG